MFYYQVLSTFVRYKLYLKIINSNLLEIKIKTVNLMLSYDKNKV